MKKLVLTMVALVAVATTSFAQFSASQLQMIENVVNDYYSSNSVPSVSHSVPSVSYSVPSVSYNVPSTVNYNTTSVSGYTRSNGTYVQSHVQLAIEPEIIQAAHTIMEQATQSILVHAEGSITITEMDTRPTFQNETYGNYEESGSSSHKEQE